MDRERMRGGRFDTSGAEGAGVGEAADAGAPVRARWAPWLLFAAVFAATAYPPFMSLHREGLQGAFRYFAADAFYYLSVADHSAGQAFFTFDGTHPTNGFHPLWQLYLERGFSWLGLGAADQVTFAAISGTVLVAVGTALFALVLLRLTGRSWLALLGAVPGAYYLLVPTLNAHHFAQWSFANGMESPLSIFFFGVLLVGLFVWRWLDRADGVDEAGGDAPDGVASGRPIVVLSVVLTAIVLSRLDDVFVFVPFGLWALFAASSRGQAVRRVVALCAVPVFAIGGYLVYNLLHAESVLPSSGAAKAQPLWALARNLYALWTTALPFADPLARETTAWKSEAWRVLQMLVPAIAATAWLVASPMSLRGAASSAPRRPRDATAEGRSNALIGMLAVYVIAKAAYNFAMVGLWHQGQWYYPLSIMTFNLVVVVWVARMLDQWARGRAVAPAGAAPVAPPLLARWRARWPTATASLSGAAPVLLVGVVVLVSANAFVDLKQNGRHQSRSFEFWLERDATRYLLNETCPGCGVLAFDDGIVSYSLEDTPTLNGLGLVMDAEASAAQAQGRLLDVAWMRGHRMLVSVNYAMPDPAYSSRAHLRESLRRNRHFAGQDLDAWDFEVAFRSPSSGVSFVRFEPRAMADADRMRPGEAVAPAHAVVPRPNRLRAPATAPVAPPPRTAPPRSGPMTNRPG